MGLIYHSCFSVQGYNISFSWVFHTWFKSSRTFALSSYDFSYSTWVQFSLCCCLYFWFSWVHCSSSKEEDSSKHKHFVWIHGYTYIEPRYCCCIVLQIAAKNFTSFFKICIFAYFVGGFSHEVFPYFFGCIKKNCFLYIVFWWPMVLLPGLIIFQVRI